MHVSICSKYIECQNAMIYNLCVNSIENYFIYILWCFVFDRYMYCYYICTTVKCKEGKGAIVYIDFH